jgi:alpha-methylacyl-CoA racemase
MMAMFHGFRTSAFNENARGTNLLDTGAPYYDTYECADGEHVAIGALEPQFFAELMTRLDPLGDTLPDRSRSQWDVLRARLTEIFKTRTRDEWCAELEGTDSCFAPVLRMSEAVEHPHNVARQTFVTVAGITQPAPAPRFSRTPGKVARPPQPPGEDTDTVLRDVLGMSEADIAELYAARAVS